MKREQDIDKIFRSHLEDPVDETMFREGDWDALEDMLDAGKKRKVFWLPLLSSVAAAILLIFGWILFRPQVANQVKKNQQALAVTKQQVKELSNDVAKQIASPTALPAKTENKTAAQPQLQPVHHQSLAVLKAGKHNLGQSIITAHPLVSVTDKGSNVSEKLGSDHKPISNSISDAGTKVSEKLGSDHKPISNGIADAGGMVSEKLGSDHKPVINTRDYAMLSAVSETPAMISANPMSMPAVAAINILPSTAAANTTGKGGALSGGKSMVKKTTPSTFRPQYALSILGSSEANGVGGLKNTGSGYNFGVLFSAELVKKFTLTTGLHYSMKPYSIPFAEYHTSYAFKNAPDNVEADCRLLDIPINIGYRVYSTPNNKITIGTGLSSYIMTHENYTYDYSSSTTPGPASYLVKAPGKYLLSIMNFQASYQHQLNSKVGISLQPYLKVPLTNIGYSQIKMESAGIAVGLNWNLNSLLKPK